MTLQPETADLIGQAEATKALAVAKGRPDIAARAQGVIDNLLEKDAAVAASKERVAEANAELERAKARLAELEAQGEGSN